LSKKININQNLFKKKSIEILKDREYHFPYILYNNMNNTLKLNLLEFLLKQVFLHPLSGILRFRLKNLPFYYKNFAIEFENWNKNIYLVIRRGNHRLTNRLQNKIIKNKLNLPEQNLSCLKKNPQKFGEIKFGEIKFGEISEFRNIILGDAITKSYFVQKKYGRKSVKKIFSELKLSKRQRKFLKLSYSDENHKGIICIYTDVFGRKNILEELISGE